MSSVFIVEVSDDWFLIGNKSTIDSLLVDMAKEIVETGKLETCSLFGMTIKVVDDSVINKLRKVIG